MEEVWILSVTTQPIFQASYFSILVEGSLPLDSVSCNLPCNKVVTHDARKNQPSVITLQWLFFHLQVLELGCFLAMFAAVEECEICLFLQLVS